MSRRHLAYLAAALTLAVGLLGLLNPALTVRLLGLEVVEPRGFSQARSTFGALYIALGAVIVWATGSRTAHPAFLRVPGFLISALAFGRLLSIIIDGVVTPINILFFVTEAASAVVVMLASFERGAAGPTAPPSRPSPSAAETSVPPPGRTGPPG